MRDHMQTETPRRRVPVDASYVNLKLDTGLTFHLQLLDVSGTGIGFPLPDDVAPLSPGTTLECVLTLEGHTIRGELEVARDERARRRRLCGARFRAADDDYRQRFDHVVTELEQTVPCRPTVL